MRSTAALVQAVDPVQFAAVPAETDGATAARAGYLRIGVFSDSTPASVSAALAALQVRSGCSVFCELHHFTQAFRIVGKILYPHSFYASICGLGWKCGPTRS